MYLAAIIVIATLVMMGSGRVPPVLALTSGLVMAGLTGLAPVSDLTSGLANAGVITVAAMLVIAKGIVKTGAVSRTTWRLLASVSTAREALRRLVVPIGVLSALINTTPIVAMLIPATRDLEQTRRVPAREVLLPIAHVTTLAGSVTLIGTSSNLLIAGIAGDYGVQLTMVSFAPVALPVAIVGTIAIVLLARSAFRSVPLPENDRQGFAWRIEIPVGSHAVARGRTPQVLGLLHSQEFTLLEVERGEESLPVSSRIEAGDTLVFAGTERGVEALWNHPGFGLTPRKLFVVAISPGGQGTLYDLERSGNVRVIAARTDGALAQSPMVPGETCFVTGDSTRVFEEIGAIALWQDAVGRPPQTGKTWVAVAILAAVIVSASLGLAPVELAAVGGALAMVLSRILTPRSAVRALDWNLLFILAGSVGLGTLVVSSGLAAELARGIRALAGGSDAMTVVVLVVATTLLTNLVTNAAAASILTPVGIGLALEASIDPVIVLATVGTCISFTLINPFSHQTNLMVMRPGGYTYAQFVRFGVPLLATTMVTAILTSWLLVR